MRPKVGLLTLAALVAALTAAAALSASPSVTITTPKTSQKVSLRQNPYLAVAGTAAFADTSAGTTEFFLRRDGCGTSADNPHLSVTSGTDGGDGCGLIFNAVVGLGGDAAPQASFIDFPASDGPTLWNPAVGRVSGANWSGAIPAPSVGKHTIYAESTQGFDTSAPASVTFSVTK